MYMYMYVYTYLLCMMVLQVQFRLKQIISADAQHKEALLRELEEFAFQGCAKSMTYDTAAAGENVRLTLVHLLINTSK